METRPYTQDNWGIYLLEARVKISSPIDDPIRFAIKINPLLHLEVKVTGGTIFYFYYHRLTNIRW